MIKLENTEVVGWKAAIRGMRNPLESWEKSDSGTCMETLPCHICEKDRKTECNATIKHGDFVVGPNDLSLMMKLRNAGTDHRKFMRMIVVYVDITAPVYWVAELDTYKVATVRNSCSFMHKGASKTYTVDDFSWHGLELDHPEYVNNVLKMINFLKDRYVETRDPYTFQQLRDVVPQGQNVKFTYMCNYETLANIYKSRKDHKLTEWHDFCSWIKTLPYSELIVGESSEKSDTGVEIQEKHNLPSPDKLNKLFNEVMRVDGRVRSYRVYDNSLGMKILKFYDDDHTTLYAVDLYRVTLDEVLTFIKEKFVKLTRQNLKLGA